MCYIVAQKHKNKLSLLEKRRNKKSESQLSERSNVSEYKIILNVMINEIEVQWENQLESQSCEQ